MATKVAFNAFMKANDGMRFITTQYKANSDRIWSPGVRILKVERNRFFLNYPGAVGPGSQISLNQHKVLEVTDSYAIIEWRDENDEVINTTEYKLA